MVRTRFAPSPTGFLHIGGLRTAAYAYALAKHEQGDFFLRIEDTDQKREIPGATQKIYDILGKFMTWDGVVIQSDRAKQGVYKEAALKLVQEGHAFYCQCEARNAKTDGYSTVLRDPCRDKGLTSGAVKLRVPDGETISFYDFILKREVEIESDKVPDTVLLKSDGLLATYHLAVAVDDHFMKISHVLRGVEWTTSTPVHVLVHRYLGFPFPQIGHLTSILDPEGGKLSKRKGNVSVEQFLEEGYLVEAIFNYVILSGWAPKDNRELFTLDEFVKTFDINGFQKSNPLMNLTKLDWFNGHYIRQKSDRELVELVKPFSKYADDKNFPKLAVLLKDRLVKLSDIDGLIGFIFETSQVDRALFVDPKQSVEHLMLAREIFLAQNITQDVVDNVLIPEVKNKSWKIGDFFMTLRIAICGTKFTPPLTEVMLILGKTETLKRISGVIDMLK